MKLLAPVGIAGAVVGAIVFLAAPAVEKITTPKRARAVIECNDRYAVGPVHIHGDKSTGQSFEWSASGPFVTCDGHGDECRCCVVQACRPGTYTVQLTVKQSRGGRYSEDTATRTFVVGSEPPPGPTPPTPPGPTPPGPTPPPPGPTPPPPDDFKNLGAFTIAAVESRVTAVTREARATQAKNMAGGLRAIVSKIAAGALTGRIAIAAATIQVFNSLGSAREAWEPAIQMIRARITEVIGTNPSDADFGKALTAVAAGLERVN
jgi:hypothetical protein